jgi:hypothetical protein
MPPQLISLLVLNLLPIASAALFGWSAFTLILLYWFENLILGSINIAKIVVAGFANGKPATTTMLTLVPFFLFHYGLFCIIHGFLIWDLFGPPGGPDVGPLELPAAAWAQLQNDPLLFWNTVLLAVMHTGNFLIYWVAQRAWRGTDAYVQVFAPYGRVAVVHLALMLAAVPVALLGQPLIAVVLLAVLKTGLETNVAQIVATLAGDALGSQIREKVEAWEGRR